MISVSNAADCLIMMPVCGRALASPAARRHGPRNGGTASAAAAPGGRLLVLTVLLSVALPAVPPARAADVPAERPDDGASAAPGTGTGNADIQAADDFDELADLSLEELMDIEVTSVAGVAQPWFDTPAAISVLTGEDIRRSGHTSLAEAFRMVPGIQVGRIASTFWAVSARGFNGLFANKMLVLIDGRSAYDPLFAGVFWDVQDVLLDDVDRIEIIRGPGATLWGANAVNGVINVTTKPAGDTQGFYATGAVGTEERGLAAVRYGGSIGQDVHYRVWGKYLNRDGSVLADDWDLSQGGLRFDIDGADSTTCTVQANAYYSNKIGEMMRFATPGHLTTAVAVDDGRVSGGHVLGRIRHDTPEGDGWSLQAYFDRTDRVVAADFRVQRNTIDIDWRHYARWTEQHQVMWGLGWRHSQDQTSPSATLSFSPSDRTTDTFSGFVQDTYTLAPEELFLIVGSKFEHNDYTGFEFQPSGRISWRPDQSQTLWGAISRPVRTPSRSSDDMRLITAYVDPSLLAGGPPSGTSVPLIIAGNSDADSEELLAYELGYRVKLTPALSLDAAAFYNDYRKLLDAPAAGFGSFSNPGSADIYGAEVALDWQPAANWRLAGSYSFLDIHAHNLGVITGGLQGSNPHHQCNVRSYLDVTKDIELNAALYYVDNLSAQGAKQYFKLDLGLTWRPTANLELSLWGQNLLDKSRREFTDRLFMAAPTEVERGVYFQATFRF